MTMYCFYQLEDKSRWLPALATERDNVIKTKKPALVSVLDVDSDFTTDLTADEMNAVKYSGPFYVDFDAADLAEATQQFQLFLNNLKAKDVDLHMLRLYATGKKGYHIEIPQQMLMGKVPPNGIANLPHIYKEIAHQLFVDTLDMRVYSGKRGRMWRCPNVKRDNGKYKVQLTVDEAFAMTAETYDQICSSPRNSLPVEPPEMNPELGLLFASARDKIEKSVARQKGKGKSNTDTLKKFKGEWPETLILILQGLGLKEDVGWNYLSMQVAITAACLGKTEEQLLTDAAPLIEGHKGDSDRYGTAWKRRRDLREMYRYVAGNPCFEFSVGGVLALIDPILRANADIAFGEYVPDDPVETVVVPPAPNVEGLSPEEKAKAIEEHGAAVLAAAGVTVPPAEDEETGPVRVAKAGIYVRTEQGWVATTDIGLANPIVLKKMDDTTIGYDLEVYLGGKPLGRQVLTMDKLASKAAMQSWTMTWSASMSASDTQTAKVADVLRKRAEKTKSVTYVVTREGIDLIVPPGAKSEDDFDVIWSSPEGVKTHGRFSYRFRSHLDKHGTFKSDLPNAPSLTEEDAEFIEHLLYINTTENLAKLLGWFCAAFMCQIIRRFTGQFPSLQIFGQAGAGKSKTASLLNHMHYYMKDPKELMAQGQTQYPMIVAVASSASMPVIFEEVKAREMSKTLRDFLLNLFRNNYDGNAMARGSLTKDQASKDVTVNEFDNSGPIVFVGEAVENQSAILERCIVVSLSKTDRYGRAEHFRHCSSRRTEMGKLGRALMESTLAIDLKAVRDNLYSLCDEVANSLGDKAEEMERPAFNIAVVLLGLQLLRDTLRRTFGDRFDERLSDMHETLVSDAISNIPKNMAEASRVLDVMAQLTRVSDPNYSMVEGVDYMVSEDGRFVDLKMKSAFAKYVRYQRSLGYETLYDNDSAFITSMSNYGGCVARAVPQSPLFDNPMACIYRISVDFMEKEEIEAFSSTKR